MSFASLHERRALRPVNESASTITLPKADASYDSAGRIVFWPSQRRVEVDDARYIDLDQFGGAGGKAPMLPGLGGSRPAAAPAPPVQQPLPGT